MCARGFLGPAGGLGAHHEGGGGLVNEPLLLLSSWIQVDLPPNSEKRKEEWLLKLFLVTCVARADLVLRGLADIRARADTDGVLGACRVDEEDRGL